MPGDEFQSPLAVAVFDRVGELGMQRVPVGDVLVQRPLAIGQHGKGVGLDQLKQVHGQRAEHLVRADIGDARVQGIGAMRLWGRAAA